MTNQRGLDNWDGGLKETGAKRCISHREGIQGLSTGKHDKTIVFLSIKA